MIINITYCFLKLVFLLEQYRCALLASGQCSGLSSSCKPLVAGYGPVRGLAAAKLELRGLGSLMVAD